MDFKQRKLTKAEWESIEKPILEKEIEILNLITRGFNNINIRINNNISLFNYLKIDYNSAIEEFLFNKYFEEKIKSLIEKYNIDFIIFGNKKELKNKIIKKKENNKNEEENSENKECNEKKILYINSSKNINLKSSDKIRLKKSISIDENSGCYEFVLYNLIEKLFSYRKKENKNYYFYYYTLNILIKYNIEKVNNIIINIVKVILNNLEKEININYILKNSHNYIEKNQYILKYSDSVLYEHQKEIYNAVKSERPKLILYCAPTGTGKTLTPLGLSESYKIIFVCAARHVGLALAKSAISINKKIAFAFGCSSAEEIRLHYFSAVDYSINKKSGSIYKVDNTNGIKVEIIICDIISYLPAMYYMLSFNSASNIITYWDEPTISLDYKEHDFHSIIKKNWRENLIPNVVLSSATLPKEHELNYTIVDFKDKFEDAIIITINSNDCKKTIPLIDNNGFIILPHYLTNNYEELKNIISHIENNLILLRYFDLKEICNFIIYVNEYKYIKNRAYIENYFENINDINILSIKKYYIITLKYIIQEKYEEIYNYCNSTRKRVLNYNNSIEKSCKGIIKIGSIGHNSLSSLSSLSSLNSRINNIKNEKNINNELVRINSESVIFDLDNEKKNQEILLNGNAGIYITTRDSYTLTDGPTLFIAEDINKIANFCINQASIPIEVINIIKEKINNNNIINKQIEELEKELEFQRDKIMSKISNTNLNNDTQKSCKINIRKMDKTEDKNINNIIENLENLRNSIKIACLDDIFIPNKLAHIQKWAEFNDFDKNKPFTSSIDEETIIQIMKISEIDDSWKILLLMGIGVFSSELNYEYNEIMKHLAQEQKLYLIIANSDYIYGTNYQFCHSYISKDLKLSQEKIIQALGRVGRNSIQQNYSIIFRSNEHIELLFKNLQSLEKNEVINMNLLFNSKHIIFNYDSKEFEEFEEIEINN